MERLGRGDGADVVQELVPEPRVEEVENGMLRSSDIEIDGHPVLLRFRVHEGLVVRGRDEPEVVLRSDDKWEVGRRGID